MQSHPSNAWKSEELKMPKHDTRTGIVRVTGPPPNGSFNSRGRRPFYVHYHRKHFSSQNKRAFNQSRDTTYRRDHKNFTDALSQSFEKSCSIQDNDFRTGRDQKDSYNLPQRSFNETFKEPTEGYSDYDDWDSDSSSELIQRCFELSQSPPDPQKPDIHSVLHSLMQEKGDENFDDFSEKVYQSGYDYSSGVGGGRAKYPQNDREGMPTLFLLRILFLSCL